MPVEHRFGESRILEDGDLLTIVEQGAWTADEIESLLTLCEAVIRRHGHMFAISLAGPGLQLPAEIRRKVAAWRYVSNVAAAAFVTSALTSRALITLLIGAINLVASQRLNVRMFSTLEEAQVFVAQERARLFHT